MKKTDKAKMSHELLKLLLQKTYFNCITVVNGTIIQETKTDNKAILAIDYLLTTTEVSNKNLHFTMK